MLAQFIVGLPRPPLRKNLTGALLSDMFKECRDHDVFPGGSYHRFPFLIESDTNSGIYVVGYFTKRWKKKTPDEFYRKAPGRDQRDTSAISMISAGGFWVPSLKILRPTFISGSKRD